MVTKGNIFSKSQEKQKAKAGEGIRKAGAGSSEEEAD